MKTLLNEDNTVLVSKADRQNPDFMSGLKQGVYDKAHDVSNSLEGHSDDFIRGYKTVKRPGWWDNFNAWLTQRAADLGNSYGKR